MEPVMARPSHGFRVYHPATQRAILRRLRGEDGETAEQKQLVDGVIEELETLLKGRKRQRRLPSERAVRKVQGSLFRVRRKL